MLGSYEICPVCFWEEEGSSPRWPTVGGGTFVFQPRTSSSPLCLAPHRSHTRLLRGLARRAPHPLARRQLATLLAAPHFPALGPPTSRDSSSSSTTRPARAAVLGAHLRLGTSTPAASPSPTAHGTSGSTPWPTSATTPAPPLPSNTAGRTYTVTSPMAGSARDPVIPDRVATLVVAPVTPMNGQGTTEHERGNGQHRRTSILQARLMPNSLSDANRNDAVTASVDRRVPCRPVVVG
ncbi:hypothetical protein AB0O32_20630 [Streptomyces rubiginosohelvolus]|uniref:hypothetical protein n=1 Tax=Streptomyces rubiginosohelvolus TaxID=67362 RepID=UPI00343E5B86